MYLKLVLIQHFKENMNTILEISSGIRNNYITIYHFKYDYYLEVNTPLFSLMISIPIVPISDNTCITLIKKY